MGYPREMDIVHARQDNQIERGRERKRMIGRRERERRKIKRKKRERLGRERSGIGRSKGRERRVAPRGLYEFTKCRGTNCLSPVRYNVQREAARQGEMR